MTLWTNDIWMQLIIIIRQPPLRLNRIANIITFTIHPYHLKYDSKKDIFLCDFYIYCTLCIVIIRYLGLPFLITNIRVPNQCVLKDLHTLIRVTNPISGNNH